MSAFGLMLGGIIVGAMLSDGVVSLIHTPKAAAGSDDAKKEANMLLLKRGAIVAGAGYAGSGINGNDNTSVLLKAACYGAAGKQAINVVKGMASNNPKLADKSTASKRFIAATLGLACPAENTPVMLNGYRHSTGRRGMRIPAAAVLEHTNNPLEAIYANGAEMTQA